LPRGFKKDGIQYGIMHTAEDFLVEGRSLVGKGLRHIETGVYMTEVTGIDDDGDVVLSIGGSINSMFLNKYQVVFPRLPQDYTKN
jgi:hypothetical protein